MKNYTFKYKDGRLLKVSYIGDGEYELILTHNLTPDCLYDDEWSLSDILSDCDVVYGDDGDYITNTLYEEDFTKIEVELNLKYK